MSLLSAETIARAGVIAVAGVVFAESGLLIGFFLPGDSLLFTAGFLGSQGFLNIHLLAISCFVAAVLGDSFGYFFGAKMGPRLLKKPDGRIFKRKYLAQSEAFYAKHGKKTIILARFTPIVRTFAPIVAGLGRMNYRSFLTYNLVGGALWTFGLTYLGYFIGKSIPGIGRYLEVGVVLIVLISIAPAAYHFLKQHDNRQKMKRLPTVTMRRIRKLVRRAE